MVKNPPASARDIEMQIWSLGREDPLRRAWPPTPTFVPRESLARQGPWGCKELDMIEAT